MPLIIQEVNAEIVPESPADDAAPAHPAEGQSAEQMLEILELAREREARLAAD